MDFNFNVNRLLPKKINKITHKLIPEDFRGDRREFNEYQRQLSRILDDMGQASSRAQGLSKPITSAIKLRDTDHIVYLLVDREGNGGLGCIVGLLKTGSKNLFMFDETGMHFQIQPRCVLDFYIHETRQRMGLGKILYQHMLAEENIKPVKLAIDRPSEKFLQFLHKHYGLDKIIPQNNKFVVFQGFFDHEFQRDVVRHNRYNSASRCESIDGQVRNMNEIGKSQSASVNGHNIIGHSTAATPIGSTGTAPRSAYGRYAATRPPCSMANIIHDASTVVIGQATTTTRTPEHPGELPLVVAKTASKLERPRSLSLYSTESESKSQSHEITIDAPPNHNTDVFLPLTPQKTCSTGKTSPPALETFTCEESTPKTSDLNITEVEIQERLPPSNIKASPSCAQEVGGNHHHSGHLDLKFYHSPLW